MCDRWEESELRMGENTRVKEAGRGSNEINISRFLWPDSPFQVDVYSVRVSQLALFSGSCLALQSGEINRVHLGYGFAKGV